MEAWTKLKRAVLAGLHSWQSESTAPAQRSEPPPTETQPRELQVPEAVCRNSSLRNIHTGRRGFIVCNGPSINKQDLTLLSGELVMTVSNGYRHPDFLSFAPRYHCIPQIASPKMTDADKLKWLLEMHKSIGTAEVFLSTTEFELVENNGIFTGRDARYLSLAESFDTFRTQEIIDISANVPGVQSVSIMCLMIAMYMGVTPIYLLGVEHDHFRTGRYEYFYREGSLEGVDPNVTAGGVVTNSLYDEFAALHRLWSQYRRLRLIAEANGIEVFNATAGGALDEFPRVRYEDVVGRRRQAEKP